MTVLYFHHFLHWRADKAVQKTTPVVALGEDGARIVGALLLLLIAITIVIAEITTSGTKPSSEPGIATGSNNTALPLTGNAPKKNSAARVRTTVNEVLIERAMV